MNKETGFVTISYYGKIGGCSADLRCSVYRWLDLQGGGDLETLTASLKVLNRFESIDSVTVTLHKNCNYKLKHRVFHYYYDSVVIRKIEESEESIELTKAEAKKEIIKTLKEYYQEMEKMHLDALHKFVKEKGIA